MTSVAVIQLLLVTQATQGATSGGSLKLEQAAYDVQSYDISIKVDPAKKTLKGTTIMEAKTVIPTASILVDLDDPHTISRVTDGKNPLRFERLPDAFRVYFPLSKQPGDPIHLVTTYSGAPIVARNAPWDGGIMWAKTPSGAD